MKEYAIDYYNKYMNSVSANSYVVTLELLERANNQGNSNYDLSKLENYDKNSSVTLIVDEAKKITDIRYDLKYT